MPSETAKQFYEEIKFLSAEIGRLELPVKFIKAAKIEEDEKVNFLLKEFKDENPELWQRMSAFYEEYDKLGRPFIFYYEGDKANKELFKYDSKEIDPINLCFLMIFGNGAIDDDDIFEGCEIFLYLYLDEVQPQFAKYILNSYLNSLDSLIEALKEK